MRVASCRVGVEDGLKSEGWSWKWFEEGEENEENIHGEIAGEEG